MSIPILFSTHTGQYHFALDDGDPVCCSDLNAADQWVLGRVESIVNDVLCPVCVQARQYFPELQNTPNRKPHRQLYIIHMAQLNYYKIGVTSDMHQRFADLQHANPCILSVVWQSPMMDTSTAHAIERHVHQMYRHVRVELGRHREWFRIGGGDIKAIKEMVL